MESEKKKSIQKQETGFTLIEILLAIGILAFGLLAIASMQVMSIQTNSKANRITEGATMAMNQLELFMTQDYNTIADTNTVVTQYYDMAWNVPTKDEANIFQTKHITITITPKHTFTDQNDIVLDSFAANF